MHAVKDGLLIVPWRHRELLKAMVRREVASRYRGSLLGAFWAFLHPLFMLLVYTFVFSKVFKVRWSGGSGSSVEFALLAFIGLMVFNLFSEPILRAPAAVVANANYVKKVVFPLEILPWVHLGAALFQLLISWLAWAIVCSVCFGLPPPTALLLPVVVLPLALLTLGFSWFLASLGVYMRDVSQIVGALVPAIMFVSAVFYPVSALPEAYQPLLRLNPLALVIEEARDVLFWGVVPPVGSWVALLLVSTVLAWLGFAWFQATRKGFADVL
jgi:lipopolysaccharide transport system permease protein